MSFKRTKLIYESSLRMSAVRPGSYRKGKLFCRVMTSSCVYYMYNTLTTRSDKVSRKHSTDLGRNAIKYLQWHRISPSLIMINIIFNMLILLSQLADSPSIFTRSGQAAMRSTVSLASSSLDQQLISLNICLTSTSAYESMSIHASLFN